MFQLFSLPLFLLVLILIKDDCSLLINIFYFDRKLPLLKSLRLHYISLNFNFSVSLSI